MKPRWSFLACVLALLAGAPAGCGSDPELDEFGPAPSSSPSLLPPGPYATVDLVPVLETSAFVPPRPELRRLANGLGVLLLPDAARPLIEIELRVRVGHYADPIGLEGTAEMMAALLREGGSAAWEPVALDDELAALGAEIAFRAEALATVGTLRCLSGDLDAVLAIFADLVRRPAFQEDRVEQARARLLAAIDQRDDDPRQAADREARRAFYGAGDPRVRRPEAASVTAIGRDDLVAFHRERFGSLRAQVAVFGDFDAAGILARLDGALGDWPIQVAGPVELPAEAPAPAARRVVLLPRPEVGQAEIRLMLEGTRHNHPDGPALRLGSYVFGVGGFGNRMVTRIRTELGLAYSTGAVWRPGWEQQGLFWANCGTRNETVGLAVREMLGVLQTFLDEGVAEAELASARARFLNATVFDVDEPAKVLARIAELEWNGYPWNFHEQFAAALGRLDARSVVDACRRHLEPARLTLFVRGDPSRFDVDLAEFGPVEIWDDAAPVPGTAALGQDAGARGSELAAHLLSGHGGRAAWEAVGSASAAMRAADGMTFEALLVYPGRHLLRALEPPQEIWSVVTEDRAWSREDGVVRLRDAAGARADRARVLAMLPLVLMRLARGEFEAEALGERRLLLRDEDGREVRIELGQNGLARTLEVAPGAAVERDRFDAYALVGGVVLPSQVTVEAAGEVRGFEVRWSLNPEVRAEWFEPPAGESPR